MANDNQVLLVEGWLAALKRGEAEARDRLIAVVSDRLFRLTRKMLRDFPRVHRWEETDDVFVNAMMRLYKALDEIAPASSRDFFRLMATMVRRELIDLSRKYRGPMGLDANLESWGGSPGDEADSPAGELRDESNDPDMLDWWTHFHEQVERLKDEQREVFGLIYYQNLKIAEAARLLETSERTVKRRWREARLTLCEALDGGMPKI